MIPVVDPDLGADWPLPTAAAGSAVSAEEKAAVLGDITRFDQDMDGSMEPAEHGRWVRFDDMDSMARRLELAEQMAQALELVVGSVTQRTDSGNIYALGALHRAEAACAEVLAEWRKQ